MTCKIVSVWANFALCSNCVWGSQAQYYPHSYKWSKEGLGPISNVRANEYPRTASRGMDKITIRGEVEHACEELGRVRGRWSPRDFFPRYLVNSLITQNNAWDKSYNRAKGEYQTKSNGRKWQISKGAVTSALNVSQLTFWPHYCGGDTWTVNEQLSN